MALKSLTIENFLGKTTTHQFYQKNKIKGANGVGKTTIKQAICFLFSGTDSAGNRNPQHLISNDQDATKVVIQTDKALITRTLTRKGNGSLKVTAGDITTTYSQTDFEAKTTSSDLFLSVFIPGYFLSLPIEKQHKIINEISPKIDRHSLIEELSGIILTSEEKIRYAFTRKSDTVAIALAKDRLDYDRQIATKQGEIKQLKSIVALAKPTTPSGIEKIPYLINLQKQWESYNIDLNSYNTQFSRCERIKSENDIRAKRRADLQGQLNAINLTEVLPVLSRAPEIEALRLTKKVEPSKPSVGNVIEADHCPTCGQTVGVKHRESVKSKNNEIMSCYENEVNSIRAFNQSIDSQIQALKDTEALDQKVFNQATDQNNKYKTKQQSLRLEIASLVDQELFDVTVQKPVAPEEIFNQTDLSELQRLQRTYDGEMSKYEFINEQVQSSTQKITNIEAGIVALETIKARISLLEETVKQVPQKELQMQMQAFVMDTVVISITDTIEVRKDGILYEYLSTGQAAKADLEISRKINSLVVSEQGKRKINIMFLDNADLVDVLNWGDTQMFAAYVDQTLDHVEIEEIQ